MNIAYLNKPPEKQTPVEKITELFDLVEGQKDKQGGIKLEIEPGNKVEMENLRAVKIALAEEKDGSPSVPRIVAIADPTSSTLKVFVTDSNSDDIAMYFEIPAGEELSFTFGRDYNHPARNIPGSIDIPIDPTGNATISGFDGELVVRNTKGLINVELGRAENAKNRRNINFRRVAETLPSSNAILPLHRAVERKNKYDFEQMHTTDLINWINTNPMTQEQYARATGIQTRKEANLFDPANVFELFPNPKVEVPFQLNFGGTEIDSLDRQRNIRVNPEYITAQAAHENIINTATRRLHDFKTDMENFATKDGEHLTEDEEIFRFRLQQWAMDALGIPQKDRAKTQITQSQMLTVAELADYALTEIQNGQAASTKLTETEIATFYANFDKLPVIPEGMNKNVFQESQNVLPFNVYKQQVEHAAAKASLKAVAIKRSQLLEAAKFRQPIPKEVLE